MNLKKLLMASVASFAVTFAIGGLWHMKLMHDWYVAHAGAMGDISRPEPNMLFIAGGSFLLSLMMSYIYPKGVESDNKMMEGLKFGVMMGILAFMPLELILHGATMIFSKHALLMDGIFQAVNGGIGGIIIAMVYGKDAMKTK